MSGFGHTLGFGEALRLSGVKGGASPQLSSSPVQPVMILADFSQTYSAQPFEGRAVSGGQTLGIPANSRYFARLHSRGPGGAVVEDVRVAVEAGGGHVFISRQTPDQLALLTFTETERIICDGGGLPPRSKFFEGHTPNVGTPPGAGPLDLSGLILGVQPLNGRLWVPPGDSLVFISLQITPGQGQSLIVWREIPEPIGTP